MYKVINLKFLMREARLGLYYVEKGASQRASKVIYDRAGSSIAMAKRSEFDWKKILEDADWFHFTGITPALGGECADICLDACKMAKELGIKVSCDLNYRKKLWDKKTANRVMSALMPYVDVCIANEEDTADVFDIRADKTDVSSGIINKEGYVDVAEKLMARFALSCVAITLRGSISASQNRWAGMLYKDGKAFFSPEYTIQIVDRVGGGDSFGGALIHGMLSQLSEQECINFAVAASCLKHTIEHDFNLLSKEEVHSLMDGNGSGRVQR